MDKIVWKQDSGQSAFAIYLTQQEADCFAVAYGKQVDHKLSYSQAAAKLGQAIMHAAACEGKLDTE